ncbi:MAG: UDP-N-acetylglucosamine 1-carboxyvinyltransferase [Clostridiales bacterium]|jgi:UDP-N-acetylglucosamine 1-carboxyvinyltransferase|nr:UDP-N-acetylglucosamine 1-carboxyvinyltransferase [Clostridiales bacterium]
MNCGKFIIQNSPPLRGRVTIGGSKNSVLPIMAAALLTEEKCSLFDVPELSDVYVLEKLLKQIGACTEWDTKRKCLSIEAKRIVKTEADYDLVGQMRASFLIMGPLLAKTGEVKLPLPGGCAIGTRPVDLHLKGFSAMGAEISQEHGYVWAKAKKLAGAHIYLDFPSVGATENIIMAATLAEGTTTIENCANEPEIVDLSNFLNSCGAQIRGAGTDTVRINGVEKLYGCDHTVIPDRIEAGTFMIAAAATNGDITVENIVPDHLKPIIAKLRETGVTIEESPTKIRVSNSGIIKAVDIKTLPYPGFPSDLQAPFMSMLSHANGISVVTETVFENRFMHVGEFKRMGADIKIDSRSAVVEGVSKLTGAQVKATDLRAGAALIINALIADGETEISDIHHIDRGYHRIEDKFLKLGARMHRV